jgi:hypothetical protein
MYDRCSTLGSIDDNQFNHRARMYRSGHLILKFFLNHNHIVSLEFITMNKMEAMKLKNTKSMYVR